VAPSPQTDSLRANALSFSTVLTQGITQVAPVMGLVMTVPFGKATFLVRKCLSRLDSRQV
jgi:hypothetical protein